MAPAQTLAQLALQKRLLLAESEARRLVLASELNRLLRPLNWVDRLQLYSRPLMRVGAPVAAYFMVRRSKGFTRLIASAFGAARVYYGARRYLQRPAKDASSPK